MCRHGKAHNLIPIQLLQGGATYAKAIKTYLEDFKSTLGQTQTRPWTFIETAHRRSHEDATHIYVARQIGGYDCGVYVCCLLTSLESGDKLATQKKGLIEKAKNALRKQLI